MNNLSADVKKLGLVGDHSESVLRPEYIDKICLEVAIDEALRRGINDGAEAESFLKTYQIDFLPRVKLVDGVSPLRQVEMLYADGKIGLLEAEGHLLNNPLGLKDCVATIDDIRKTFRELFGLDLPECGFSVSSFCNENSLEGYGIVRGENEVQLMHGKPGLMMSGAVAHELGHAWAHANSPMERIRVKMFDDLYENIEAENYDELSDDHDSFDWDCRILSEGFAVLTHSLYAQNLDNRRNTSIHSDYFNSLIRVYHKMDKLDYGVDWDNPYVIGFGLVNKIYTSRGFGGVVDVIKRAESLDDVRREVGENEL